jgi:phasin
MAYRAEDMFSFAAFDPAKFAEGFKDLAGRAAGPTHDAYSRMKAVAEEATKTVESTIHSAQTGTMELGIQALEAMRTSTDLSLHHMEALFAVKSVSEFVELQTSFMRRQAEATAEQAKVMQDTARKLAETMAKPGAEAAEKAMASFRAS